MQRLTIDIETFSDIDLPKTGVYKYAESPNFEITLFAYAYDEEEVQIIDLTTSVLPSSLIEDLRNPNIIKQAFNANFERVCINAYLRRILEDETPIEQWQCTSVLAGIAGLPMHLDGASKALGLDQQKDAAGKALIRYFAMPCKPTKTNGNRTRNMPSDSMEKWEKFMQYCKQDVVVERAIRNKLGYIKVSPEELALYHLDQAINDYGVLLDPKLVKNAISIDTNYREKLMNQAARITGLDNPNSRAQLISWLGAETASTIDTLRKADIPELLKKHEAASVQTVLNIRQELSKTSTAKYTTMEVAMCEDNRIRGLFQFYGANRTGRWAGRLVQPQNLPKNFLVELDAAREMVLANDAESLEFIFGNVPDTLSQLIRTAFVAGSNNRFMVADFSAIEARVIAWLANEKWRLEVFNTHGKIYEASASAMFKVPLEKIKKGNPEYTLRAKGKVAELACGYQGGTGALIRMGALEGGLKEEELQPIVDAWRKASPNIVKLWYDCENAAIEAMETGEKVHFQKNMSFHHANNTLFFTLPSGRQLAYYHPKLKDGGYGKKQIAFMGMDQVKKLWCEQTTYSGKLIENATQAVARDCLAFAMLNLHKAGYNIAMTIHDEVVIEAPNDFGSLEDVDRIMSQTPDWAKGLPLTADSYQTNYYKKD